MSIHPLSRKKSPILVSAVVFPAHGPPVRTNLCTGVVWSPTAARASSRGSVGPSCNDPPKSFMGTREASSVGGDAIAAARVLYSRVPSPCVRTWGVVCGVSVWFEMGFVRRNIHRLVLSYDRASRTAPHTSSDRSAGGMAPSTARSAQSKQERSATTAKERAARLVNSYLEVRGRIKSAFNLGVSYQIQLAAQLHILHRTAVYSYHKSYPGVQDRYFQYSTAGCNHQHLTRFPVLSRSLMKRKGLTKVIEDFFVDLFGREQLPRTPYPELVRRFRIAESAKGID